MNRRLLLEMCLVSLLNLPERQLQSLLPTLAAMAEPYLDPALSSEGFRDRIRHCLGQMLDGPDADLGSFSA